MQSLQTTAGRPRVLMPPLRPAYATEDLGARTSALLAHSDPDFVREAERLADRIGMDIAPAQSAKEAQRLALVCEPEVIILDTKLADESGYLVCAKIKTRNPDARVILLAEGRTAEIVKYAQFAGAEAVYHRNMTPEALVDLVLAMTVHTSV